MSLGSFESGDLTFVVDDGFSNLELGPSEELTEEELDVRLSETGKLPDLGAAPIASWILARLTNLATGDLGLSSDTIEYCDGGVYVVDFVVRRQGTDVAKAQLQAGMIGAALLGVSSTSITKESLVGGFVAAMVATTDVATCQVRVHDTEWDEDPTGYTPAPDADSFNVFGFDGDRYLGSRNIKERD